MFIEDYLSIHSLQLTQKITFFKSSRIFFIAPQLENLLEKSIIHLRFLQIYF